MKINKKISKINFTDTNRAKSQIKYIVMHYVGAVSTAKNNADYFYSTYRGASAHYFVDDNEIWQIVEDNDVAWHCGADKYYCDARNSNSIGIEMCCYKNNGKLDISEKVENKSIELVKELMKKYNISVNNVVRHYDVSHKVCPAPFVNDVNRWNNFKSQLSDKKETNTNPTSNKRKIAEDGRWGEETTRKAQEVFGTTVDGIVSNQYISEKSKNEGLFAFEWLENPNSCGSELIKAIQRKVGARVDGFIGKETITKMQKWLGTTQDGYVSNPSDMVRAFQKWLNKQ